MASNGGATGTDVLAYTAVVGGALAVYSAISGQRPGVVLRSLVTGENPSKVLPNTTGLTSNTPSANAAEKKQTDIGVHYSDTEIAQVAKSAGFTGNGLVMAIAIALAESGGWTANRNTNNDKTKSVDRGLWQINDYWHKEVSDAEADNPSAAAAATYRISGGGATWVQWSTFTNGSYKQYIPRAQAAAAAVGE